MTEGELKLYHNTFEAGRRQGMKELAEKIKEEMGGSNLLVWTDWVNKTIDKCLKEAGIS